MNNYNGPKRLCHRGLVQYGPENSLDAVKAAAQLGMEGVEVDIRKSSDGVVFLMHDSGFTYMTDGKITKQLCELTSEEALKIELPYADHLLPYASPVPYSENAGSRAPYTDEQRAAMRAKDTRTCHLLTLAAFDEFMDGTPDDFIAEVEFCDDGLIAGVMETLKNSKNFHKYIFFSGNIGRLYEIRDYFRENPMPEGLRLGANIRKISEETVKVMDECNFYEVALNDDMSTEDDVKYLKSRGLVVFSNLGDYPDWWKNLTDWDFAAFKTNYAEQYTDFAAGKKI